MCVCGWTMTYCCSNVWVSHRRLIVTFPPFCNKLLACTTEKWIEINLSKPLKKWELQKLMLIFVADNFTLNNPVKNTISYISKLFPLHFTWPISFIASNHLLLFSKYAVYSFMGWKKLWCTILGFITYTVNVSYLFCLHSCAYS